MIVTINKTTTMTLKLIMRAFSLKLSVGEGLGAGVTNGFAPTERYTELSCVVDRLF